MMAFKLKIIYPYYVYVTFANLKYGLSKVFYTQHHYLIRVPKNTHGAKYVRIFLPKFFTLEVVTVLWVEYNKLDTQFISQIIFFAKGDIIIYELFNTNILKRKFHRYYKKKKIISHREINLCLLGNLPFYLFLERTRNLIGYPKYLKNAL